MKTLVIRSFDTYIQAHIARGVLESAGINAFLQDENSVTINPILTNAVGGIKLLVRETDAVAAILILDKEELSN